MTFIYVLLSLFVFGLLVVIHELGHFLVARAFGVGIHEFSIGMGPKLFSKKGKKWSFMFGKEENKNETTEEEQEIKTADGEIVTAYSVRMLPIGGYVSMLGEDEASDDPRAFGNKKVWQRILVVLAGPVMNVVLGFLLMLVLVISTQKLPSTVVARFQENATSPSFGLQVGDEITHVNGVRVFTGNELVYEIMNSGYESVDLTVKRNGKTEVLKGVSFPTFESEGVTFGNYDFWMQAEEKNVWTVLKHSFTRSCSTVKMITDSLSDLITGRFGLNAVSGPVGVTSEMVNAAKSGPQSFLYLVTFITINLGVFNLLPVPALDGGRLMFLFYEAIFRKPVDKNVEGYIHFAGMMILLAIMALIICKDVIGLIT